MQVLSCAPAHVLDSFSHYEGGEPPRGLDTELYGETNEKTHGGRVPSGDRRFRVNSRKVGNRKLENPLLR